jgi:hypothetical protein
MLINELYKHFETKCYIRFRNCENNFKIEEKEFQNYEEAKKWGMANIENFHIDMIRYR